jgi:hypothetical protein
MDTVSLQITSQMLQAILVGASALAGFTGIILAQIGRIVQRQGAWDKTFKVIVGLLAIGSGVSFVFCIFSAIAWFHDSSIYTNMTLDPGSAYTWFEIQSISFLSLFLFYGIANFFNEN